MAAMEEQDSIPGFEEFMVPVMRIAADGELRSTRELGRLAADALGISSASREQTIKSGSPRWYSRAHWAITYLVQAGLLVRPSRGFVKITEEGRKLADNLPPRLDKKYLTRYPKFVEFLNRRGRSAGKTRPSGATSATESDQSPEELISEAVAANVAEVESDLLTLMRALEPDEFERLVLNVLITMGYGTEETATHTGRSGDEGIDG